MHLEQFLGSAAVLEAHRAKPGSSLGTKGVSLVLDSEEQPERIEPSSWRKQHHVINHRDYTIGLYIIYYTIYSLAPGS